MPSSGSHEQIIKRLEAEINSSHCYYSGMLKISLIQGSPPFIFHAGRVARLAKDYVYVVVYPGTLSHLAMTVILRILAYPDVRERQTTSGDTK